MLCEHKHIAGSRLADGRHLALCGRVRGRTFSGGHGLAGDGEYCPACEAEYLRLSRAEQDGCWGLLGERNPNND